MKTVASNQITEAEKHLEQAYLHWEANELEQGLRECESVIQLDPALAEAHNLRGIILEELGRGKEAIAAYREAVRLDTDLEEARENLTEAEKAIKLVKETGKRHLERAYAREENGDLFNALRECEAAIQLDPDLAEAHNLHGIILDALEYTEEAIAAYRQAIRLDPALDEARENLDEITDELRKRTEMDTQTDQTTIKDYPEETGPVQADQTIDQLLSIDTPENVMFDYNVSGIGSRFLAALVDSLIIGTLQIITLLVVFLVAILLGFEAWDSALAAWGIAILGLIAFALLWGYYIFFEVIWNGQSPGKRWVGLRVIRTDGTPLTFTESVIRNLVRLVDFLPAYYGVGVVTMFINTQSRRLGDLAAGTLVVYDHPTVTLESLEAKPDWSKLVGSATSAETMSLPVERLTDQDIQMAEEFLNRRQDLSGNMAMRAVVARRIAEALLKRMEMDASQINVRTHADLVLEIVLRYRAQKE